MIKWSLKVEREKKKKSCIKQIIKWSLENNKLKSCYKNNIKILLEKYIK